MVLDWYAMCKLPTIQWNLPSIFPLVFPETHKMLFASLQLQVTLPELCPNLLFIRSSDLTLGVWTKFHLCYSIGGSMSNHLCDMKQITSTL